MRVTLREDILEFINKELDKPAGESSYAIKQLIRHMYEKNGVESVRIAKKSDWTSFTNWNDKLKWRIYLGKNDILGDIRVDNLVHEGDK